MTFIQWFDTLVEEKGIDTEQVFEVEAGGVFGNHYVPFAVLREYVGGLPANLKADIKETIVKIDFVNGAVEHYLQYIAECMVKAWEA